VFGIRLCAAAARLNCRQGGQIREEKIIIFESVNLEYVKTIILTELVEQERLRMVLNENIHNKNIIFIVFFRLIVIF
jgi:hypothetical protein